MDIILFVLVIIAWVGVVTFRRFHHHSQNRSVVKDTATLIGYWGTYEIGPGDCCSKLQNLCSDHACRSRASEAVELRIQILKRLG